MLGMKYNVLVIDIMSEKEEKLEYYNSRREEIINACEKLYDKYSFKEITIKLISEHTTFSRPSIYNYFETKEEIFLALFKREYEKWIKEISDINKNNEKLSKDEFSKLFAKSIEKRKRLLKLLSMNMYDLEENSRLERLINFKVSYGKALAIVKESLIKFFNMKEEETTKFLYSFFPFMFGLYPYSVVTDKQKEAMFKAGIDYKYYSIYDIAYNGIRKLLG